MSKKIRELVRHTFNGGRFEDHGIDVDALQDLLRYKNLIVDVAKELWRRNNPKRLRLPKHFDDLFAIRFYTIEPNCATIPLHREVPPDEQMEFWKVEHELDDAVDLVCRTIDAASNDDALPDKFPKHLLPLFNEYGKTLKDDEWIEQRPSKSEIKCRYDSVAQSRLTRWISEPYEDKIEFTGEVTMARVRRPRMAIEIDGREVEAEFRPQDEEVITTALRDHDAVRLWLAGKGQFAHDGVLQRIVSVSDVRLVSSGEIRFDSEAKPIWERFAEIASEIPDEELDRLPVDGATRLDDYIYGNSKE